jgi:hypothetical protein
LRLTASDSVLANSDDMIVTVNSASGSGSLTVSNAAPPASVSLSTEGTDDWAHWGLSGTSFNHKSGVTSQISNYTPIGNGSIQQFTGNSTVYNWTGGTPTASASNVGTGLWVVGNGNGYQITLPADTTPRTLKVYLGLWSAGGRFEASLSDNSAPVYVDTSLVNSTATSNRVYTLTYQAASTGKTLTVKWTVNQTFNAWSNVTFQAATLVGAAGPTPTPTPTPTATPTPTPTPTPGASEFQISSSLPYGQLGTHVWSDANGNFIPMWQSLSQDGSGWGIFSRRYNSVGVPQASEFQVNTLTIDDQFVGRVGIDANGNFAIVWESNNSDGSSYGVWCRRYSSTGVPLGPEFRVNTFTTGSQNNPYIVMAPTGSFVVVWVSDNQDGSLGGIYGQRYDSAGNPVGGEFQINTFTTGSQRDVTAAMDANGNFVVAWDSDGQDGGGKGIYARRYNSSGVSQGGEFLVNTTTANDQADPVAAMDSTGDFVIAWDSVGQDGTGNGGGSGVYAQRYNSAGTKQGREFRVNTFTTNDQIYPSVSMDPAGNFVIAWESVGQDGSGRGIYAQRYNSSGATQGAEFRVNVYTSGDQYGAYVAKDGNGNFVIVWTSFGQDGSAEGVYGRRYDAAGNPLIAP